MVAERDRCCHGRGGPRLGAPSAPLSSELVPWAEFSPGELELAPAWLGHAAEADGVDLQHAQEGLQLTCLSDELARKPWTNLGYLVPAPPLWRLPPPSADICWPAADMANRRERFMTAEQLASQMHALEVDGATTFLCKVVNMLPASIMGSPPVEPPLPEEESLAPARMVPTPAPPRRASARIAKSKMGMTQ